MLSRFPEGNIAPKARRFNPMSPAKAKAIFNFEGLRKRLGFNQSEMASRMHMSPRTYFSLETDPSAISQRHVMIAQMVSLQEALTRGDKSLADTEALALAAGVVSIGKRPKVKWT